MTTGSGPSGGLAGTQTSSLLRGSGPYAAPRTASRLLPSPLTRLMPFRRPAGLHPARVISPSIAVPSLRAVRLPRIPYIPPVSPATARHHHQTRLLDDGSLPVPKCHGAIQSIPDGIQIHPRSYLSATVHPPSRRFSMLRSLLLGATLFAFAAPAVAQSSPDWTGFYVGGRVGYVATPLDTGSSVLFDKNLDGTFGDTVTTAAGANAFSTG